MRKAQDSFRRNQKPSCQKACARELAVSGRLVNSSGKELVQEKLLEQNSQTSYTSGPTHNSSITLWPCAKMDLPARRRRAAVLPRQVWHRLGSMTCIQRVGQVALGLFMTSFLLCVWWKALRQCLPCSLPPFLLL